MAACNNTTLIDQIFNSTELQSEYFKNDFIVHVLDYNCPVAMFLNKVVTPVWIIVGIFGNILSALVWANPHMRTCNTAAYYLTCLAVADGMFLILQVIYELENPWLLGSLDIVGWCQILSVLNISVQYLCVFLVFAFTVERFLSICHPFKSERFGKTRTPRTIVGLVILALLLGLPQAYFWEINSYVGQCKVRIDQGDDETSFFGLYTWISELSIFGFLPLTVLVLNSAVLLKIRDVGKLNIETIRLKSGSRTGSQRSTIQGELNGLVTDKDQRQTPDRNRTYTKCRYASNAASKESNPNNSGTTITLLWVSFYLIATTLPNTIVYSLQNIFRLGPMPCQISDMANHPTWQTYFKFASVKLIIKEISISHHVGNIFIYMATSRRFVKMVMTNLTHRSRKHQKDTNDASVTVNTVASVRDHTRL